MLLFSFIWKILTFSFITNVKRHNSNVLLLKMHEIDQSTYTLKILKLGKLYGVKEMSPLHGLIKELKPISKEKVQGESKGKKTILTFFPPFTTIYIHVFDNFLSSFIISTISNYSVLKILTNNKIKKCSLKCYICNFGH